MKAKKAPGQFENWRIRPELHTEVAIAAASTGFAMYELAEQAWNAYKGIPPEPHSDAKHDSLAHLSAAERRIVDGVIALMRDEHACEVHMPVLLALLHPHLKPKPKKIDPPKEGAA